MHRAVVAIVLAGAMSAQVSAAQGALSAERAWLVSTLEQLVLTGEPRHTSHDEGERLQRGVDAAIRRGDSRIERLAQRAATPLLARITPPISSTRDLPAFSLEAPTVLKVPRPVAYTAEVFASIDGGPLFRAATTVNAHPNISTVFPASARRAGVHHVRFQAHIQYKRNAFGLTTEIRNLPEVVYALFDLESAGAPDARYFTIAAARTDVRNLDDKLPNVPLGDWLNIVLADHGTQSIPLEHWRTMHCDQRIVEAGLPPRTGAVCAVIYFQVKATVGQIWIRTGRLELAEAEVSWVPEPPRLEAFRLLGGGPSIESTALSELPGLLRMDPSDWPSGDISVSPEDISATETATREGRAVNISATIRNVGGMDLRGVFVEVFVVRNAHEGERRSYVVDIPRRGTSEVTLTLPMADPYATVIVHAMQLTEHAPFESWTPDPTPDDTMAFRIVNPQRAPKNYAASIRAQCSNGAPGCRGY